MTFIAYVREDMERRLLLSDIDAVPLLAVLRVTRTPEADELWRRAVEHEWTLRDDPAWQERPRRELYAEVGRLLESDLGDARSWVASHVH